MTANQISYAKQREERRHNLETENIERTKAGAAMSQAESARLQAMVARGAAEETARANREKENYNWWYGGLTTTESNRHNLAQEAQNASALAESIRHNQTVESLNERDYLSMERLRLSQGQASLMQAAAAQTSASANLQSSAAALKQAEVSAQRARTAESELAELIRHNSIGEREVQRHNVQMETVAELEQTSKDRQSRAAAMQAQTARGQLNLARDSQFVNKANTATGAVLNIARSANAIRSGLTGGAQSILSIFGGG